jgi:polyphosphate kinase 2 (PPK2 family)
LLRIKERVKNPLLRWKTVGGSLDIQNINKWDDFTKAKDIMF